MRIAKAWATLMDRLGYTHCVAQGGDWGNAVSEQMALQRPPGLLGIHTNMAATVPADVSKALAAGGPPPDGLAPDEVLPLFPWCYGLADDGRVTGETFDGPWHNVGTPEQLAALDRDLRAA